MRCAGWGVYQPGATRSSNVIKKKEEWFKFNIQFIFFCDYFIIIFFVFMYCPKKKSCPVDCRGAFARDGFAMLLLPLHCLLPMAVLSPLIYPLNLFLILHFFYNFVIWVSIISISSSNSFCQISTAVDLLTAIIVVVISALFDLWLV